MGRIDVTVRCITRAAETEHAVKAYRTATPGLVVHKKVGVLANGSWKITHEPSGYAVDGGEFHTLRDAKACAADLGDINEIDWAADGDTVVEAVNSGPPEQRRAIAASIRKAFKAHGAVY